MQRTCGMVEDFSLLRLMGGEGGLENISIQLRSSFAHIFHPVSGFKYFWFSIVRIKKFIAI